MVELQHLRERVAEVAAMQVSRLACYQMQWEVSDDSYAAV